MVFENGEDSVDLIATFGIDREECLTKEQARHFDPAAPISSAFMRTCQRLHQESTGVFDAALQAYWDKQFLIKITSHKSRLFAWDSLYARPMSFCLPRIKHLIVQLDKGALHIKLVVCKKSCDDWRIHFVNDSTFQDPRVQAWIEQKCKDALSPWLVYNSQLESKSEDSSYGTLAHSELFFMVEQMSLCLHQEGIIANVTRDSPAAQMRVLGFAL